MIHTKLAFLVNPPVVYRKVFGKAIWDTLDESVLLTFDDGPSAVVTPKILKILELNDCKALFFVNGSADKSLLIDIYDQGHSLGNHLYTHQRLTGLNKKPLIDSLKKTNVVIEEVTGKKCEYFRPPYGTPIIGLERTLEEYGMKTVMWSLLSWDFRYEPNRVMGIMNKYLKKGSIVVFHNNSKVEDKIERIVAHSIELIHQKSFKVGNPDTCLKL